MKCIILLIATMNLLISCNSNPNDRLNFMMDFNGKCTENGQMKLTSIHGYSCADKKIQFLAKMGTGWHYPYGITDYPPGNHYPIWPVSLSFEENRLKLSLLGLGRNESEIVTPKSEIDDQTIIHIRERDKFLVISGELERIDTFKHYLLENVKIQGFIGVEQLTKIIMDQLQNNDHQNAELLRAVSSLNEKTRKL